METLTKTYCTEMILNAAPALPSHWGDVSHGGQHRNATMLDLGSTTSLEVLHASVGRETCGIPETHGRLHAEFILEGAQRRCCVVGPVSPGASGQTILWHGSHCKDQKHRGDSIKISWNINVFIDVSIDITVLYTVSIMIWYNMMWYDMVWYAKFFVYTHLVNKTNITHQICHVFAHASTVWYQIHNLIMSLLFPGTVYNSSYW